MANFTPNVNLEKPLGSEHYLIPKFNANMDKIDVKLGDLSYADRIAYIAEKIRNKNLVTNGDFSNDFTGWLKGSSLSTEVIGGEVIATVNSITSWTNTIYQSKATNQNDVIYFRLKARKITNNVNLRMSLNPSLGVQSFDDFNLTDTKTYYSSRHIATRADNTSIAFGIRNDLTQHPIGTQFGVSLVSFVNLTSMFGVGNEPTKAEMDAAIELLNGWTDVPVVDKYLTSYGLGTAINALAAKTTPVDADMIILMDSAATNAPKKLSWTNIKATLKTYFDSLYATIANLNLKAPLANPTFTGLITTAGQIKFPATQVPSADANTLDDYEKGTWTPVPVPTTGLITGYTSNGKYTKIGNQVTVNFECIITNAGTGAGSLKITGLPFVSSRNFTGIFGVEAFQSGAHIAGHIYNNEIQGIIQISNGANIIGTGRGAAMKFTYLTD